MTMEAKVYRLTGSLSVADGVADVVAERVVIRDASTDLLRDDLATFLVANLQK